MIAKDSAHAAALMDSAAYHGYDSRKELGLNSSLLRNRSMSLAKHHILVIDDDAEMRSMVADFLRGEGHEVTECRLASEALARITRGEFALSGVANQKGEVGGAPRLDLVITDLNMPEMTGIEFTEKFRALSSDVPVILITAFGSIETAIEAIRKGAYDYTTKPFKLAEMSVTVARALRYRELNLENARLHDEIEQSHSFSKIIGKSPGMREVFDLIRRVAPASANVLIMGESGTGKERVAHAIHEEGPRRTKRFVAINCTAIPEALLESELFGHAKGSFTGAIGRKRGLFEEADGGTIFLDEIGDMDLALQAKLLRVIQEKKIRAVGDTLDREVDVRIIAATHKDLKLAIKNGSFREDLYYRLSVIPVVIPPLRHRKEDIPLLAEHFLKRYAAANVSPVKDFTKEALSKLIAMPWEGNVRELENVIERSVVLARGEKIDVGDLPSAGEGDAESFFAATQSGTLPTLEDIERRYIKFVLDKTGGRKEKASQILGVNRRTLYRKEREYGFVTASDSETEPGLDEDGAEGGHGET
jgi:DNA-binding NtrC family response regulator